MLAQTVSPICRSTNVLMLMEMFTLVRLSKVSPRKISALQREESPWVSPCLWMGGIRDRILNPVFSVVSVNDLVSCIWSSPCTRSPLLSVLRLLGHWTLCEIKSRSEENMSRRLLIALERVEMQVVVLSVALISSTVSMRIGGLMWSAVLSKDAKMILNLAQQVSDAKMAGSRVGLCLTGIVSLGMESAVSTDWLLAIAETTTDEVVGAAIFMARRWLCASLIALMAAQFFSLSSERPLLWISSLVAHCWSRFRGGRSTAKVGLLRTASTNGLDQVMRSLLQRGPVDSICCVRHLQRYHWRGFL